MKILRRFTFVPLVKSSGKVLNATILELPTVNVAIAISLFGAYFEMVVAPDFRVTPLF